MINIRKAGPADIGIITEIGRKSFVESHGSSASAGDIENYVHAHFNEYSFEKELTDQGNLYHIIFLNEQPAGYSKLVLNSPHINVPETDVAKLERLYLLKDFYGKKLGQELFNFNVELSLKAGQKGIWLYVWKGNERAVKFYQKAGFEIVGSHDFKITETHYNPNYQMWKSYEGLSDIANKK